MSGSRDNFLQIVIISVVLATLINYILLTNPFIQKAVGINLQGSTEPTDFSNPDYDSGWVTIPDIGTGADILTLTHNLGTRDIFVYMIGKDNFGFTHTSRFGGSWWFPRPGEELQTGAYWVGLSDNEIQIWRQSGDVWNSQQWISVRCLIWVLPP